MSEKNYYIYVNGRKVVVSKGLYGYDRQSERLHMRKSTENMRGKIDNMFT